MTTRLHVVDGWDNDLYAFYGRTDVPRCSACRMLLDKWNEKHLRVEVPSSMKMDISSTYDGVTVVSGRFVETVVQNGLLGLRFVPLDRNMAVLLATRRVAFDAVARGTRFERRCETCGEYKDVAGATPAYLKQPVEVAPNEFVWTDVEFGSNDGKSPLLVCGEVAGSALRQAKLRALQPFAEVRFS